MIDQLHDDYVRAREAFTAVLDLERRRELGDRSGEADTRQQLAELASQSKAD